MFKVEDKVMLLPNLDEVRKETFKERTPDILLPNLDFDIKQQILTITRFQDNLFSVPCAILKGGTVKDEPLQSYLIPLECIKYPSFLDKMLKKFPFLYK